MMKFAQLARKTYSFPRSMLLMATAGAAIATGAPVLAVQAQSPIAEIALTFNAQRSLQLGPQQNFWAEGGGAEIGMDALHGLGIAADISAVHTASINATGVPLTLVSATFGPRYRWHDQRRLSLYGEGLVGEANGFDSLFPSVTGAQTDANSLATEVGGGVDLHAGHHLKVRILRASWLRTQFPNSTGNVQNNLLLGAGLVFTSTR